MQLDPIQFWARHRPNAIALTSNNEISYRVFDQAINKVGAGLLAMGVPSSGLVAIQTGSMSYLYLIERALHRMGLATVVVPSRVPPTELLGLLEPDLFLTFEEASLGAHSKTALLSREWIQGVLEGPVVPAHAYNPKSQDRLRIVLSSGTTGTPKKILVTRASLELRLSHLIVGMRNGYAANEKLLVTMGPDTIAGLTFPLWCWSMGGCVVNIDARNMYEEIVRIRPNNIMMSTGQLETLIKTIPENALALDGMRITAMGSPVSKSLALTASERLTKDLYIIYGSSELGSVSFGHTAVLDRHERAVGYVMPGRDVEIVDGEGSVLPTGKVGIVRVRREEVFAGYLDDAGTTSSSWRDGWFYPGDLGALSEDGLLVIVGRVSEIMNLGGVKIDPVLIDEFAKTIPGVRDAAAFSIMNEAGVEAPWIAIVRDETFDAPRFRALVLARWPELSNHKITFVDAIPRNSMMKVERQKLKSMSRAPQPDHPEVAREFRTD